MKGSTRMPMLSGAMSEPAIKSTHYLRDASLPETLLRQKRENSLLASVYELKPDGGPIHKSDD
jgi:hypothetical protein